MSEASTVFKNCDVDGDGYISTEELKTALTDLAIIPTENLIQGIMDHYDEDANGKLDFEEFEKLVKDLKKFGEADPEEVLDMFNTIDQDKSGYIDEEELRQAMTEKFDTDDQTIKAMVKMADKDGDGKISISEFIGIIMSLS
ncbi:calmodulin-1-like [Branchiostoma floridae]|uniref:Calmodulin-1-like n=1 Tax=Branchiostoma floridae TaxID=7739 RepID=A0A9J7M7T4_BRAFL|nr:calmodulin-1-like [Branchiostoma floridae]